MLFLGWIIGKCFMKQFKKWLDGNMVADLTAIIRVPTSIPSASYHWYLFISSNEGVSKYGCYLINVYLNCLFMLESHSFTVENLVCTLFHNHSSWFDLLKRIISHASWYTKTVCRRTERSINMSSNISFVPLSPFAALRIEECNKTRCNWQSMTNCI